MSQIAWQQRVLAAPAPQSDWRSRVLGAPSGPDRSWAGEAAVGVRRGFDSLLPQLWSGATSALRTIGSTGDGRQSVDAEGRIIQTTDDSPYGRLMSYMDQTERAMTREQGELLATMPRSPRSGMWDARGIAGDLGEATPQLAAAIGAGAAAAPMGLAAGIAAFSGTAAAPVMGQTYQDALKEHGNPELAAREAFTNGSVTAVTSIVPGMAFLRRMPGGNKIVEAITSRAIGRLGVRAVAEGGQEAAEQVGQIATEELVRRGAPLEQAVAAVAGRLDEVGYAALLGSMMGAGAHVGLEAATGRAAAPTLPQDRPVAQPTTGPSEAAPTQPEPATPPAQGPMAAAAVQTPEGVVEYVRRNPDRAAQMPEKPSRGQMADLGIAGNTTAQQRARIAADVRAEVGRQRAAGELTPPPLPPAAPVQPTIAQEATSETQPDGRRVDGPEQQGPADARQAVQEEGISPEVARPDQPGPGRPARPRQPFSRAGVIDQLAAKARQYLPPRTTQEDFELREDGNNENFEFSATFPDRLPAEIREAIEGEPHLHMQLRIAKPGERAGGPDALHTLGADRYVQYLRESHQSEVGRIVEGLASSGAADIDPEIKMLLWLEEHRITGRKIPQSTPTNTLVQGDTFTIHGEQFAVRVDDDDRRLAIQANDSDNALVIDLDAVENVPVDRGSLVKAPKAQPPAAQPAPAEPYRSEAISKPTQTDLLGQPITERMTGSQAELLARGRADDAPRVDPDADIRKRFNEGDTTPMFGTQAMRLPTGPLTENQFYQTYYQHKITSADPEAALRGIQETGFKRGIGPNVIAAQRGAPIDRWHMGFLAKPGDTVILVPRSALIDSPNGLKIKPGWRPQPHEIVRPTREHQPMYELYAAAAKPDIQAMAVAGSTPVGFNLPRQAVPIDPNRPQPITPGRVPIKGPISEHQIRMRAERGFGEPIRRDRLRIKALGQHDDRQRTIRLITDRFGDVGAVMHEVAHGIDTDVPKGRPTVIKAAPARVRAELAGLDYDQSKRRPSEGFAEFLRYAITHDDVATRAPVTTAWFQQTFLPAHPKIAKELGVIRAMTNQWRGQTPGQRQEANTATSNTLPVPETRPERVARAFHVALRWADTNLNDKGAPLRRMRDAARKAGYVVTDETDPHALLMFHQLLGSHYSNEAIRGKGVPSVRNPGQILYKPLKDILSQISEKDYKDWRNFVIARHSLEVLDAGINPGGTREDHQAVFDEFKGRADFVKAADEFTAWNNAVLEMMAETGAISPDDYNSMVGKWKHYVPLRRAIGGGGTGTRGGFDNPMLARTGGDLPVIDPILTAQQRLLGLYNRATRQIVAEATLNMAEETGTLGGFAERVPPNMERSTLTVGDIRKQLEAAGTPIDESTKAISDDAQLFFFRPSFKTGSGSHIMRFYRNGENQLWEFPEDVYEVFDTAADIGGSGVIDAGLGIIRTAARAKRLGATGVNPARIPVNLTIDTITSWLTTDINNPAEWGARQVQATYRLLLHHIQSAMHSTLGTEAPHGIVDLYNRLGGNIEGRMAVDFAEIAAKRNQMLSNPTRRKALRIVGTPRGIGRIMGGTLGVVRDFVNFTEAIPRLAEMTDHLAAHGHTEATIKAGTPVPRNVLVGGFNKASDLTLNYRRGGTWARQANQYVPFLNSAIRSYEKLGRTVKEHPYRTALRLSPMIAMTVILWALRKDDDEYQEEPDWLKYGYWNFTDSDGRIVVRIPRAHEWGWLFTSSIEAALNAIYEKDPDLIGQYLEALAQKMTPNIMPAGVQEVMEVGFNQDFFRQNEIVDQNMARFLARDQTRPESTIVARQLGRLMGWPPAKVDHFVNGLTGGSFERYTNFLSTFELGPFVGSGVTVKNDYLRTIGEFHDEATRAEQRFNSSRLLPGGDTSELGPGDQALGDRNHAMSWYAGVMTDLRKLVPPDATRDERYAVNRYIAGLARHAMGKEELEQFPNPFHVRDLPPEVAAVIRKEREGLQRSARINAQTARSREQVRRARMMLRSLASPDPSR